MAKSWYPADLIDETTPDGQPTPDAWLEPPAGGVTCIFNPDDEAVPLAELVPGDTIGFCWFEPGGTITVHVMPDGSFTERHASRDPGTADLFDGGVQEPVTTTDHRRATTFWLWEEPEICGDTLTEFAQAYAENDIGPDGDDVDVSLGTWSDTITFRLSADGRHLEEVPASAEQENNNG